MADRLIQQKLLLANNRWLLLVSLMLFALVLNREGDHLPTGNEFVYLLYFYKAWHPTFLAADWTFAEPTAGHAVFNDATGWLTLLMPLRAAAWVGRILCWAATFIGLFRIGRHFKIPPWAVWVGIVLWLLQRQSPVTREWMVGTFEAKVVAYPCLLFAIDAALSRRILLSGILCGVAFSFHSAVGMWGGAALGLSVLACNPIRKTIAFSIAAIVLSLPGLISSWNLIFGPHAISPVEAKYLTTIALPDCFDPAGFPHTWVALLLILPIFAWLHARWRNSDRQIQQLLIFQIVLAGFFAFGILARILDRFDWIELYPMRVYAVFALLLFFWQLMSIVVNFIPSQTTALPAPRLMIVFGILIFLSIPSPVLQLRDMIASHLSRFLHPSHDTTINLDHGDEADFIQAAKWINQNTTETDLVIAPPWCNEAYYYINRPLIANWHAPRYDAMTEWKARIESLVGDTSDLTIVDAYNGEMNEAAWSHYAHLTIKQIDEIQSQYGDTHGAKWLLTTGQYPYPMAYRAKTYSVYEIPSILQSPIQTK